MLRSIVVVLLLAPAAFGQSDWQRITPESAGLDANRLDAMETAIKAGEFKKIGSVLVARHGRLAYERYFEGDAATLREIVWRPSGELTTTSSALELSSVPSRPGLNPARLR